MKQRNKYIWWNRSLEWPLHLSFLDVAHIQKSCQDRHTALWIQKKGIIHEVKMKKIFFCYFTSIKLLPNAGKRASSSLIMSHAQVKKVNEKRQHLVLYNIPPALARQASKMVFLNFYGAQESIPRNRFH
jgi:hypothetical protein